jgi:hypothetical protein
MVGVLRQLFGDNERGSFASMADLLRRQADPGTASGRQLLNIVTTFESAKRGVLDGWDAQPGGTETSPQPPLVVLLDWITASTFTRTSIRRSGSSNSTPRGDRTSGSSTG